MYLTGQLSKHGRAEEWGCPACRMCHCLHLIMTILLWSECPLTTIYLGHQYLHYLCAFAMFQPHIFSPGFFVTNLLIFFLPACWQFSQTVSYCLWVHPFSWPFLTIDKMDYLVYHVQFSLLLPIFLHYCPSRLPLRVTVGLIAAVYFQVIPTECADSSLNQDVFLLQIVGH